MLQILKILLFPFSLVFALIAAIRNWLYNSGIIKSTGFEVPIVNVGNLRVGGTGKTPHVEFLINHFKNTHQIATLSRGFGRETRGFVSANENHNARDIGDEPLQLFKKFGQDISVVVCEDRVAAVPQILREFPDTNLILLDDAFQHRRIKPRVNILLTGFDKPFYNDFLLPTGMLREPHYGAFRADIVIMSKCPLDLSNNKKERITKKIKHFSGKKTPVFFSSITYGEPISFDGSDIICPKDVFLISALANSDLFIEHVKLNFNVLNEKHYADHYDFYSDDVEDISSWLKNHPDAALLCTEKDFVKLGDKRFESYFRNHKLFYLPISVDFGNDQEEFLNTIKASMA